MLYIECIKGLIASPTKEPVSKPELNSLQCRGDTEVACTVFEKNNMKKNPDNKNITNSLETNPGSMFSMRV